MRLVIANQKREKTMILLSDQFGAGGYFWPRKSHLAARPPKTLQYALLCVR
jgi:hypothetical protein